jgi:siroheme synthase-like protein
MTATPFLPLSLRLEGRSVVVIGGGSVAARKVGVLLRYGAKVTVIAPGFDPALADLTNSALTRIDRGYQTGDLAGAFLAVAATDDRAVNRRVYDEARAAAILVNVSDDEALCDFTLPAIVDRDSIQVAISTAGQSPALARLLRETIEALVGDEYVALQKIAGELRETAKATIDDEQRRSSFFRELASTATLEAFRQSEESGRRHVAGICSRYAVPWKEVSAS